MLGEVNSTVEPNEVSAGISQLADVKLIDEKIADHLTSLHAASFKKLLPLDCLCMK